MNGMACTAALLPFGGTFLVFSDYMRPRGAPRGAHASPGRSSSARTTRSASARTARRTSRSSSSPRCAPSPASRVLRPADANETAEAWRVAIERRRARPRSSSRARTLPVLDRTATPAARAWRAAPTSSPTSDGEPDVILIGHRLRSARCPRGRRACGDGIGVRVVSMPCWELFDEQDQAYHDAVLPPRSRPGSRSRRGSPSAGRSSSGRAASASASTASAPLRPGKTVARELGISPEAVAAAVREVTGRA